MNEEDTKLKLITPAIEAAGWDRMSQVSCEYQITDGEIVVRGKMTHRKRPRRADYLLSYVPDVPLAVVEAKDDGKPVGAGMQQAIAYATTLDLPFAYATNGRSFLEHDMATGLETELPMSGFPGPEVLWTRYRRARGLEPWQAEVVTTPYHREVGGPRPRYYQRVAVNRVLEAAAKGRRRMLLVMATGTGKTFTAFQIVHRMREAGLARKVLYLADRNVLVDQTISGDFKPLEKVTTKVQGRKLDSAYEVYFSLYQQLVGTDGEEIFRAFDPSFFDLVIVDECHRGSAADDSAWRKVLDYFSDAVHVGMTATPKESKTVSNTDYFGEPVYTYSLRQGIEDGFLAPYKVVRIPFNVDTFGYRPREGQVDDEGREIEDRWYLTNDFDREIVIRERTEEVARAVTEFLKGTDRMAKTIVFCVDIDHAERMRQALVNENADMCAKDPRYVMRITGDEREGKAQLDNFMDPDEPFPTVVTTSKLLTTGVNCKTCRVIVFDNVFGEQGMTEFKQILGRGTRIKEDYGKLYFTVLDFRNASRLFADPDFDGDPVQVYEPQPGESVVPPEEGDSPDPDLPEEEVSPAEPGSRKYQVHGVDVRVVSRRVEYYSADGGLVTESLTDYTRRNVLGRYATLDRFVGAWNAEDRKRAIVEELEERGVFLDELRKEAGCENMSDFDLVCHVAFDAPPLTRSERAREVKKRGVLYEYAGTAREVLEALLDKYETANISDLHDTRVLDLEEFRRFGSPMRICREFGGKQAYVEAARALESELFTA